jgi:Domain of unknown function (DUF4845)
VHKQKGMGILGIFFILAMIFVGAIIAMKCVPVYLEYFAIKKTFSVLKGEGKSATVRDIKQKFDARATIDDIRSITANDLEISKEGDNTVVSASYQVVVPLFANISLLFDFKASTAE